MILSHQRASEDISTVAGRMEAVVVGVSTSMQTGETAEPSTLTALSPAVYMFSEGESSSSSSNSSTVYLLYKFVCYVIKDSSRFDETVLAALAEAMLPTARKFLSQSLYDNGDAGGAGDARSNHFLSFAGLFTSLVLLMSAADNSDHFVAAYGKPSGNLKLIDKVVSWLTLAKEYLSKKDVIQKNEKNVSFGRHQFILESSFQMLSYLSDIFNAFEYKFVYLKSARRPVVSTDAEGDEKTTSSTAASSSSSSTRLFVDDDIDEAAVIGLGYSDNNYLDHNCYYGEEDEELCEKLCTFTETQKEFINQHWYHCHTCKMLDGVGVCNVCAQVCHRGHDVTYSKHGSFFCNCGASEDGSCRALVRRQPKAHQQQRQPAKRAKQSTK
ncbi:hypothetical protein TYRP_005484 [Tyrophagus putrescentiae]|nr:hypothetical protein TYRP_005484 [Tyrophagus putrescentiae]